MIEGFYKLKKKLGIKAVSDKRRKRYQLLFPEENAEDLIKEKDEKALRRAVIVFAAVCLVAFLSMFVSARKSSAVSIVERNEYGGNNKAVSVTAAVEGETYDLEISVKSRSLTDEEIDNKINAAKEEMLGKLKGENESLGHVSLPLDLSTNCSDEDVTVFWQCESYDLIDYKGNIIYSDDFKDGTDTTIKLLLVVGDEKRSSEQKVTLYKPEEGEIGTQELIESEIARIDDEEKEKESFKLPESINGKEVSYYQKEGFPTWAAIFLLGIIAIGVLLYKEKSDEEKEVTYRSEELKIQYPELVSKLSIYVGAGLSVKKSFEEIAGRYKRIKSEGEKRNPLYEEILLLLRMMDSGKTEEESLVTFGDRTGHPEYLRLVSVLVSNRKNGATTLRGFLEAEAKETSILRLEYAKRRGEKISSKLLLPMIILFAIVLTILIIPAFLGW